MDRNLLGRATEGTDAPTPGYLYVDLAKAATSNPTACSEMAHYLTNKLQNKQNPNIKMKCCKVIAKLCEQVPRNQFRRCIAQDATAVAALREAIAFRGVLDPVQGDAKNERVRLAAREALDAVYAESTTSEMSSLASPSYAKPPHASNTNFSSSSEGSARRMEGIGNPRFSDPRLDPRYNGTAPSGLKEVIAEAGEVLKGMIQDPLARNVVAQASVPSQGHSGPLPGYGSSFGRTPPGAAELSRQTGGQWTMASNRGPTAIGLSGNTATNEYHKERDNSNSGFNSWSANSTTVAAGVPGGSWGAARPRETNYATPSVTIVHNPSSNGTTTGASSDGNYEKQLILELCPPGGLKPVPPPDKLAQFARSVASLNADLICPILLDFLEEGQPWVIRAKALCVMESAIQNGMVANGTNPYKSFFHTCAEEIRPLAGHPRNAIQEPAKRVLILLGVPMPDVPTPSATPAAPTMPPPAPMVNLLDYDDGDQPPAPPMQPPPPPPTIETTAPVPSMFGGMTVKGSVMSEKEVPVAAAPATSLLDLGTESAVNNTANSNMLFADLAVQEKTPDVEPPSTAGSAFSFMHQDTAVAPHDVPLSTSFDPLTATTSSQKSAMASLSMPTTTMKSSNNKVLMMPLSTEQMQAMAYQQQMLQMQQMAMMMRVAPPPSMQFRQSSGQQPQFVLPQQQQPRVAKKDDKKFDFVKDAMESQKKK